MRLVALAVATAALIATTLERARTSRFALWSLWVEAFPRRGRAGAHGIHLIRICAAVLLGGAIVAVPVLVGVLEGAVVVVPTVWTRAMVPGAVASLALIVSWAALEEFLFRGTLLPMARRLCGTLPAVLVSAILFAAAHVGGRGGGHDDPASVAVWAVDGVLFALAWVATGSLWLPTALHVGKNVAVWLLVGGSSLALVDGPARVTYVHPSPLVGSDASAGWLDVIASGAAVVIVAALAARRAGRSAHGHVR